MGHTNKMLFFSKMLSIICAIAILLSVINLPSLVFAVEEEPQGYDASGLTVENMPQELAALAGLAAQSGVARTYSLTPQNALPEKNLSVYDAADLNKITVVNGNGEKTSYVFANDVKYINGNSIYFINNDFVASNKFVRGTWVAYENVSSDKKVYMARRASNGVIYIDGDIVIRVKPNAVYNNIAQLNTVIDNGLQRTAVEYDDVFGNGTMLQYMATYGGMKENLYLEQYNGINSFSYTLEIPNMTAALMNQGRQVGIYNADGNLIYVFGQPFAEDSYTENGVEQPHYTDNCGYDLAQLGNGVYTLTMWVDPEFLADEDTTYPVVIDPPMQVSKGSVEDATVSSSGNNSSTSAQLTVGFDGDDEYAVYIKNNFLWYYRHLCTSDITNVSYVTQRTGGTVSGLFVNAYDSNAIMNMETMTFEDLVAAQGTYQSGAMITAVDNNVTVDITNLAIKWLKNYLNETNAKRAEYGFILRAMEGQNGFNRLASSESTDSICPYFAISYNEEASVENGVYLIKNEQYGSYLAHNVIDHGENVNVLPYRNCDVQMWEIQQFGASNYGEILYTISPYDNLDYCLNSANPQNLYENGVNVDLSLKSVNPSKANGMLWRIVKNGNDSFRIMPAYSTMQALTADNSGEYNSYLYEYYGWTSMKWTLIPLTANNGGFSLMITEAEIPTITLNNFLDVSNEFNVVIDGNSTSISRYESDEERDAELDQIEDKYRTLTSVLAAINEDAGEMYNRYLDIASGENCATICGNGGCRNLCRTYVVDFEKMIVECDAAKAKRNSDINTILGAAEVLTEHVPIGTFIEFAQTNELSTSSSIEYLEILKNEFKEIPFNVFENMEFEDTIEEIFSDALEKLGIIADETIDVTNVLFDINDAMWFLMIHAYNTSSKCLVRKTSENTYDAYISYYLYDVFDWNKNDTTLMFGLITQQDIWELQYDGRGKGYMVTGEVAYHIQWTKGDNLNDLNILQ